MAVHRPQSQFPKIQISAQVRPGPHRPRQGVKVFCGPELVWRDSRDLGKANPVFLKLKSEIQELEKENSSHPDWPELKSYLRSLTKSDAHKEKFNKFLSKLTGALRDNGPGKTPAQ